MFEAFGDRIAADPAGLAHVAELERRWTEAVNRGIFQANRDTQHYSQRHMADIMGVSRQAIAKRIGLGEAAYAAAHARAGAGPLVRLADIRTARAAALRAAGVPDVTGSAREREAS
jgi:hypothetical protein